MNGYMYIHKYLEKEYVHMLYIVCCDYVSFMGPDKLLTLLSKLLGLIISCEF